MKVVKAQNQKTNLTAVEPIRHGDTLKEAPAKQRESVATTFFRPASFLSGQHVMENYGTFQNYLKNLTAKRYVAVFPSSIWVGGVAPNSFRFSIWISS